jgi:beta-lactamase superfamily II metal-dependent hydrolase
MDHLGEAINVINCINVDNVIFNYGNVNDNEKRVINVLKDKNIKYYF